MKRRNFLSGLLALPFVRWFVPKRFTPDFEAFLGVTHELSPEQVDALILLNQIIKQAIRKGSDRDWCKRPFRVD